EMIEWPEEALEAEAPAAPAPAENAPDWLNAMVPGLDVDYSAPEDEQIESEFVPGSENRIVPAIPTAKAGETARPEYAWLVDIVDEESRQTAALGEESRPQPRFRFSRLPVWLRPPTEKRDEPDLATIIGRWPRNDWYCGEEQKECHRWTIPRTSTR
ncbi:MAG: hypothetical protein JNM70_20315, partial [Anaerolineae bacterium]|nr:hypothetical protein [Anaerolineae bacterium]